MHIIYTCSSNRLKKLHNADKGLKKKGNLKSDSIHRFKHITLQNGAYTHT